MLPELKTFLIAMSPIGELRASIPIAINLYHLSPLKAYLISVLGNLVPVILILATLKVVSEYLSKKFHFFNRFFNWFFNGIKEKHLQKIKRWKELALILLVAIPLPFTGAWTGSLVAFVFGLPYKKSFALITLGVMIAGFIVVLLNFFGVFLGNYFGWQTLLGILIVIGFLWLVFKDKNFALR